MTIRKLLEKYKRLEEQGYETIYITQVTNDLYEIVLGYNLRNAKKLERKE